MKIKKILAVTAALVMMLGVTACGKSDDGGDNSNDLSSRKTNAQQAMEKLESEEKDEPTETESEAESSADDEEEEKSDEEKPEEESEAENADPKKGSPFDPDADAGYDEDDQDGDDINDPDSIELDDEVETQIKSLIITQLEAARDGDREAFERTVNYDAMLEVVFAIIEEEDFGDMAEEDLEEVKQQMRDEYAAMKDDTIDEMYAPMRSLFEEYDIPEIKFTYFSCDDTVEGENYHAYQIYFDIVADEVTNREFTGAVTEFEGNYGLMFEPGGSWYVEE